MFGKFVIILLCCAFIDTKRLVQRVHDVDKIKDSKDGRNPIQFSQRHINSFVENFEESEPQYSFSEENHNDETFLNKQKIQKIDKNDASLATREKSEKTKKQFVEKILPQMFLKEMETYPDQFHDLKNLLKQKIGDENGEPMREDEKGPAAVGFGGNFQGDPKRIMFGNMTIFVNKVIKQAQRNLEAIGPRIYANNHPPYVIHRIPRTPITFQLKYIQGASTLTTQGTSMGLHYFNALYTYNQFKFEEIKYIYEVQIKPMNLFTIRKSLTVIVENSRVWMPTALEDNNLIVQRFEFVLPDITVECADSTFINYILNDIVIDKYYPEVKKTLGGIVSRDTKLILDAQLEKAQ